MYGYQALHGLDLDNDLIFHKQVETKPAIETYPVKFNRDSNLAPKAKPCLAQCMAEAFLVGTFEQPGSQGAVHRHCATNDAFGEF